jgi:hypothetical protein
MSTLQLPIEGKLLARAFCGHKILVEDSLIGVNHSVATTATCWDCLSDEKKQEAITRYAIK